MAAIYLFIVSIAVSSCLWCVFFDCHLFGGEDFNSFLGFNTHHKENNPSWFIAWLDRNLIRKFIFEK